MLMRDAWGSHVVFHRDVVTGRVRGLAKHKTRDLYFSVGVLL